jgi:hypothetical protein
MRLVGYLATAVAAVVGLAAASVAAAAIPDARRYLRMRKM